MPSSCAVWSFDNQDPLLHANALSISVQIMTTGPGENTYSLHAGSMRQTRDASVVTIRTGQLTTAGQQQHVAGSCEIRLTQRADTIAIVVTAAVEKESVRAVKLILRNLPGGRIGFTSCEAVPNLAPVPPEALALSYPSRQGGAPVWFLATDGERGISFSSMDITPRQRRFVASRETGGGTRIKLVFDWPTLALVDTTLRDAPKQAERVVNYARARIKRS